MARSTPFPFVKSSTTFSKSSWLVTTTRDAPYANARFSLPGVPVVPITRAPAMDRELGAGEPDGRRRCIDQDGVAPLQPVDRPQHVIGGSAWIGNAAPTSRPDAVGQLDEADGAGATHFSA